MKIAVEGCMHGDLETVYKTIQHYEQLHSTKIDLLLCCGDFQAVRNATDMESLSVPQKYREMKSFGSTIPDNKLLQFLQILLAGITRLLITRGNYIMEAGLC